MIDRYTDEVEVDLHTRWGLDLVDFFPGSGATPGSSRHSWRKLANAIDKLERTSNSWLVEAQQNDVKRMRALANAGLLDAGGRSRPAVHEYDLHASLLASILLVLQSAYSAEGAPKPTPVAPTTARDVLAEETAQADVAAIYAGGRRVTDDEYRAWVASGGAEGDAPEGVSLLSEL